jgi:hypothetical protein
METEIGKATGWNESDHQFNGRTVSRIVWETPTLNFYNKKDHAAIETFLESKLIHFDVFYQEFKDILINLVE